MTTVTFRTDEKLKKDASKIYEDLGINLTTALNMFMKQTVIQGKYPCSLETSVTENVVSTYPSYFFNLFGKGNNLGLDEEPIDLPVSKEDVKLWNII